MLKRYLARRESVPYRLGELRPQFHHHIYGIYQMESGAKVKEGVSPPLHNLLVPH